MAVKVESRQISRGRLLDGFLLVRRELRLQLIGDRRGDLALDGEHIGQIAIVGLCPQMRVGASVDQLGVDPDALRITLDAAFEKMRNAKLFPDLAQIARGSGLVLHY